MGLPAILLQAYFLLGPLLGQWTADWTTISNAAATVTTIQADFVQTKSLKMLARPIVSEGKFVYRRPGEIRWEYVSPLKSVLLATPKGVRRFTWRGGHFAADADTKLKPVQMVLSQMERWLRGDFSNGSLFTATLEQGPPARVKLVPADAALARLISHVYVVLSSTPGVVDTIEIWEGQDSVTRISLKNVATNVPIPNGTFESAP